MKLLKEMTNTVPRCVCVYAQGSSSYAATSRPGCLLSAGGVEHWAVQKRRCNPRPKSRAFRESVGIAGVLWVSNLELEILQFYYNSVNTVKKCDHTIFSHTSLYMFWLVLLTPKHWLSYDQDGGTRGSGLGFRV